MDPLTALGIAVIIMAVGVIIAPIDQLPNRGTTTGRMLIGILLFMLAGGLLSWVFVVP